MTKTGMKLLIGNDRAELTPTQQRIAACEEGLRRALVRQLIEYHVPPDETASHMLSVTTTLLIRVAATAMAHPEGTAPMCQWTQEFAQHFPEYVARMATASETKQ